MKPMIPFVHINGTSAEELIKQQQEVFRKANELLDALRQASPHARDYYPYASAAFTLASDQHREIFNQVNAIASRAEAIAVAVYEQCSKKGD